MLIFGHTYILNEVYTRSGLSPRDIPLETILGNVLPNLLLSSNLGITESSQNLHRRFHDRTKTPETVGFDLSSDLERGFAIHVMADNYSRVGHYWRAKGTTDKGFLKGMEREVDLTGVEIRNAKQESTLRRRILQCGLDILVLRDHYDVTTDVVNSSVEYLDRNRPGLGQRISTALGIDEQYVDDRLQSYLLRFGSMLHYQASEQIRAYPVVRTIEDLGEMEGSDESLSRIQAHIGYELVIRNLTLLEQWKEDLRSISEEILRSPMEF
mgnify:CR=1 FL=1|jgi:hypothetical protein